jgi:hypothetical protein
MTVVILGASSRWIWEFHFIASETVSTRVEKLLRSESSRRKGVYTLTKINLFMDLSFRGRHDVKHNPQGVIERRIAMRNEWCKHSNSIVICDHRYCRDADMPFAGAGTDGDANCICIGI